MQLLVGDEVSFWKRDMLEVVIIPLAGQKNTCVILISSPPHTYNWFTALMDLKNPTTKEPMFLVLKQSLICRRCREYRKHPEKCTHLLHEIPPWKEDDNVSIAKEMYQNNTTLMMAETMGEVSSLSGKEFSTEDIKRMEDGGLKHWNPTFDNPEFIFIACDPNAGATDHTAIIMLTPVAGQLYVRAVMCCVHPLSLLFLCWI